MKARLVRVNLNIVLLFCCLILTGYILWSFVFTGEQGDEPGIQLIQASQSSADSLSWRWFGSTSGNQQELAEASEAQEQLAEASINAELVGVMRTPAFATATIKVNGRPEKVFSIGDELQSGVELLSVSTSRVVLDERGRRVQITMRRPQDMPQAMRTTSTANSNNTTVIQQGFSLANMFEAVPVQLENAGTGFKLDGISEEMLSMTEIEEGDVVVQVGSSTIDELMANPGQWMNYSSETTLPVTVMRNGQETTIFVNASSLSARILPNLTSELMQ
tara:strand:- start:89025 stop:89852 length:828 start_codon:yes stop_codon:yes gene_type:complete